MVSGQRLRERQTGYLAELWWENYIKWDNGCYTTTSPQCLAEEFEPVGSSMANARSDVVRQIMCNMGYSPTYYSLYWGLEPMWRAAMGVYADELEVRRG